MGDGHVPGGNGAATGGPLPGGDSGTDKRSLLKDAQDVLGFLLAGSAGLLGFLGLRSSELTAVLRNDTEQATLIAFVLLLSVLAAAVGVAIPERSKAPFWCAIGFFFLLLAGGACVVYMIPVQSTSTPESETESLVVSCACAAIGLGVLLVGSLWNWRKPEVSAQFIGIMASIILLATSLYGAMRLEIDSQLSSVVQISASVGKSDSGTALSVHVSASKIKQVGYVGVNATALPGGLPLATLCAGQSSKGDNASCDEDPCAYLKKNCVVILAAAIPPDPNGDVDETLSDALITGQFQEITVEASVCLTRNACGTASTDASQVDLHLANLPPETAQDS
ncbi:MAG TPA: hypothetical protein VGG83_17375 [Trebonia sp.]